MSHPIYDLLQSEPDPTVRRRIKAQALAAMADMVGASITRGDFRVTLTYLAYRPLYNALIIRLRVNRISNGNNVTPADLNPIIVINPPILVPDDAGDIEVTSTDPITGAVTILRFREDLRGCLRAVVRDLAQQRLG